MGNEADAQEAVQDAFLCVFRGLAGFDGGSRLSTWLHAIAVRACLMKLRTRRRRPETPIEELLPQFHSDGHRVQPGPAWGESIEQVVQRQESRDLVRRCIDQLPDSYRTVLLLRDIEELSTEEAAKLLGTNAGVVKTRLHRARQACGRCSTRISAGGTHRRLGGARRMTCREFIEFLNDYFDAALPPTQRHFFDEHLAGCLDCQTYLESYKRTVRLGKLALADRDGDVPDRRPGVARPGDPVGSTGIRPLTQPLGTRRPAGIRGFPSL